MRRDIPVGVPFVPVTRFHGVCHCCGVVERHETPSRTSNFIGGTFIPGKLTGVADIPPADKATQLYQEIDTRAVAFLQDEDTGMTAILSWVDKELEEKLFPRPVVPPRARDAAGRFV